MLKHVAGERRGEKNLRKVGIRQLTNFCQKESQEVSKNRKIKRIVLSTKLHFGVPPPEDSFFADNFQVVKGPDGLPLYRVTDKALLKNFEMLQSLYNAAVALNKEVWNTSRADVDVDMCSYAKSCHFISSGNVPHGHEVGTERWVGQSFSSLMVRLNSELRTC